MVERKDYCWSTNITFLSGTALCPCPHCLVLHAFHNNHLSQLLHLWPHLHTYKKMQWQWQCRGSKQCQGHQKQTSTSHAAEWREHLLSSGSFIHAPEIDDDVTHSQQWDRILWPQHWCVLWHSGYSTSSPLPRLKKIWLPSSHLGHSSATQTCYELKTQLHIGANFI